MITKAFKQITRTGEQMSFISKRCIDFLNVAFILLLASNLNAAVGNFNAGTDWTNTTKNFSAAGTVIAIGLKVIQQTDTIATLRSYTGTSTFLYVKGHTSVGDGGDGLFYKVSAGGM